MRWKGYLVLCDCRGSWQSWSWSMSRLTLLMLKMETMKMGGARRAVGVFRHGNTGWYVVFILAGLLDSWAFCLFGLGLGLWGWGGIPSMVMLVADAAKHCRRRRRRDVFAEGATRE